MLLTPGVSFGADWVHAARTIADVTAVTVVKGHRSSTLSGEGVVVRIPRLRPTRWMRSASDRMIVHRLQGLIEGAAQLGRPFDLIHTHFFASATYMPLLRRTVRLPYVITEHSSALTGRSPMKHLSSTGARLAKSVYEKAERVIVPSAYLADCIEGSGLCRRNRMLVTGDPVDIRLFHPQASDGRSMRVVSVGRLDVDKDPRTLLEAFRIATQAETRLRLEIIGDGPESRHVREYVGRHGLERRVTLLGQISRTEVADRVRTAGAFALASRVETFCVSAVEAIACGVPVVMPSVGALPELVGYERGVLVPPGDPEALGAAILDVVTGPPRFDRRSMAAYVRDRFSHEAIGASLREVYASAVH